MLFTIFVGLFRGETICNFATEFILKLYMSKIYVNEVAQEVDLPLNVNELIRLNDVQQPDMVSVQVNEEFAEREEWVSIQLKEGDKVDFLYFMGGGS